MNIHTIRTRLLRFFNLTVLIVFSCQQLIADNIKEDNKEGFDVGEMIMHHISDAHDWHLFDWNNHPVSVPLPIIIYHEGRGFTFGISSAFNHGNTIYKGYKLNHEKIAAVNDEGQIDEDETQKLWDFSITKNVTALFASLILLMVIFTSIAKSYTKNENKPPKGLQSFLEPIILYVRDDIAIPSIGERKYKKFMPYLLTLFFFIWINNLLGLIPVFPGGANLTGNIAVPIVMAFFTFLITNINGNKHYWKHVFAMPGIPVPILLILTPIEFAQIFIRPIVLVVRLFANITAGHIVLLVFFGLIFIFGHDSAVAGYSASLPSLLFTIFINCLELLVALVQAYVFTLLSAIYFGMAVAEGEH